MRNIFLLVKQAKLLNLFMTICFLQVLVMRNIFLLVKQLNLFMKICCDVDLFINHRSAFIQSMGSDEVPPERESALSEPMEDEVLQLLEDVVLEDEVLQPLDNDDHLPNGIRQLPDVPLHPVPDNSRFFSDSGQQIFIAGQRFLGANGELERRIVADGDLYITRDGRVLTVCMWPYEDDGRTNLAYCFTNGSASTWEFEVAGPSDRWGSAENFYNAWYDSDGNPYIDEEEIHID